MGVPCLGFVACALLCAVPAGSAPSYSITFSRTGFGSQFYAIQATPLLHHDSFTIPGGLNSTFVGDAFAYPGHIGQTNRIETLSTGPNNSNTYQVDCAATADDFIISGPPATSVAGQLHLRIRGQFSRAGGFAGSAGHGSKLNVDVRARFGAYSAIGDLVDNNSTTSGTGILAGLTDPSLDFVFELPGNFPVGAPFNVVMALRSNEYTYGNSSTLPNPGFVMVDASSTPDLGLFLEESGGQVMTLPAGYTLTSASWGVVDNHFSSVVGVEPTLAPGPLQLSLGPNPASGMVRILLTLPGAGIARVSVYDLAGRRVRVLSEGERQAGRSELVWDGRTDAGGTAGAGLYFARAEAGGRCVSRRFIRVH